MQDRDEAPAYFLWQAERFGPYGTDLVVDHGAGTGALTEAIVRSGAKRVVAIEPDETLFPILKQRFADSAAVTPFKGTLSDWVQSASFEPPALIASSNVLEHIEDDRGCLREMLSALRPGGRLGLYLPARQELFGSFDTQVGHYRRYSRSELVAKVKEAGFLVRESEYRNVAGVLPWLWGGRVMKKQSIAGGSIKLYDRFVFPVTRWLEDAISMPYGLNVLLVAEKQ
jgi:SAM-dependent methyltransferase